MDSSWYFDFGSTSFLLDPWLVGSEIDGFKWLNEQWHVHEPVSISDLPEYDFIVISQSYEDHCHLETLALLDPSKPIVATRKAYNRLRKKFPDRAFHLVDEKADALKFNGIEFRSFRPKKLLDPIYYSMSFTNSDGRSVFYAPHGFTLSEKQLARLQGSTFDLLITTFTDFRIPEILGGHVNPGLENAALLHQQLNPKEVIHTHDEPKRMQGLVARTAKITYPDYGELLDDERFNFRHVDNYAVQEL